MSMRLKEKVAIVTGAGQGLGAATAKKLAAEGAFVAIADINEQTAQETTDEIGSRAITVLCDVSQKIAVQNMVATVVETFGRIDILINNAGIVRNRPLVEMTEDEWSIVLDVNLRGAFLCMQAVAPHMMDQRHGKIVNVSSRSAYGAVTPGQANYASAKAGILGLTRTMAMELGPHNINVNAIAPGFIDTILTRQTAEEQGLTYEDVLRDRVSKIPLRRAGRPEDVANVVCFLVSEDASYVNGEIIHIFGGPAREQ